MSKEAGLFPLLCLQKDSEHAISTVERTGIEVGILKDELGCWVIGLDGRVWRGSGPV